MTYLNGSRRRFIKGAGAAGVLALAGCTGGDDGGGTTDGELTEVNIVYPPWPGLPAFNYITEQTDILEEELNERGYTVGKVTRTWDDTTLFMSGEADFMPTAGAAESARMAMEREIELTVHAQAATNYMAWYVREGSDLDPANTGGFVETMQKVTDEERPYGHAGWNQGIVWPNSAIMYDKLDMSYGPETDPPLEVQQADFATLPQLLLDEELDIVTNAPPVGTSQLLVQDDPGVVPVAWEQIGLQEAGLSPRTLNLGGFTSFTEFSENHEAAIVGWMSAWQQGVEWASNSDNWDDILDDEDNWGPLAAESREEAEINLKFTFAEDPSQEPEAHTDNPLPVILQDTTLTDERIDDYIEAIEYVETTGALQEGDWRDRLDFKALSI